MMPNSKTRPDRFYLRSAFTVRDAIPKARELATAEFTTLRLRLLKIAARVV